MSCTIPQDRIDACVAFHGHLCPGLSIGIRAAEHCLKEYGHNDVHPVSTVCETDMCAVDAIQFLTGCTFGKGNLIHRDWGKTAFTLYRRETGQGTRLRLLPEGMGSMFPEARELTKKSLLTPLTEGELERLQTLRRAQQEHLMEQPLQAIFEISPARLPKPRGAAILETLTCARCGEGVMESRTRRFQGENYCIPCFSEIDQKL